MDLAELIQSRQAALGNLSDRELARRATAAGTKIDHSSIADYRNGTRRSIPRGRTVKALANALGVSEKTVTDAALKTAAGGESAAATVPEDVLHFADEMAEADLSPEERRNVIAIGRAGIQAALAGRRVAERDQNVAGGSAEG